MNAMALQNVVEMRSLSVRDRQDGQEEFGMQAFICQGMAQGVEMSHCIRH